MGMLNFRSKIWNTGNSYVVTIPKNFIGVVSENETYTFSIDTKSNNIKKEVKE